MKWPVLIAIEVGNGSLLTTSIDHLEAAVKFRAAFLSLLQCSPNSGAVQIFQFI
jgi:hypothetical protein